MWKKRGDCFELQLIGFRIVIWSLRNTNVELKVNAAHSISSQNSYCNVGTG